MTSDDDLIRFHNGDTLDNIPVIRDEGPRSGFPWKTVAGVFGAAALVGGVIGLSFALGDRADDMTSAVAGSPSASASASQAAPSPTPAVTVTAHSTETVTAEPTSQAQQPYASPELEQVYVVETPATGGDPGMDYCFSFDDSYGTSLLVNAPAYLCQDFLFSTHPDDMQGVFENSPVDCSGTPGARSAEVTFATSTYWGAGHAYTCLIANDGA